MRKRTVNHVAKTFFWYVLYFLPVLAYLIYLFAEPASGGAVVAFTDFLSGMGLGFLTDNIIINTFRDVFGVGGVFPFFSTDTVFLIFQWYIGVYLLHLFCDFLLFLPKLAHKCFDKLCGGDD